MKWTTRGDRLFYSKRNRRLLRKKNDTDRISRSSLLPPWKLGKQYEWWICGLVNGYQGRNWSRPAEFKFLLSLTCFSLIPFSVQLLIYLALDVQKGSSWKPRKQHKNISLLFKKAIPIERYSRRGSCRELWPPTSWRAILLKQRDMNSMLTSFYLLFEPPLNRRNVNYIN